MISSRIHIMHPMQERLLLQLVQLLQFDQTAPTFNLNITNKVMFSYSEGNVANIKLQQFSLDAYNQNGFRPMKNSQDTQVENPNLFTLSITEFIKIVEYGDTYNWGMYARRILTSYRPNDQTKWSLPALLDSGLLKSFKGIFKQFLSRDPGGCLSYGLDKDMTVLLEKLVSDVTFPFQNDEEIGNKPLFVKFKVAVLAADEIGQKTGEESSIVTRFFDIAVEATKIRLSLFTELFHQAFKKLKFLESTFELLQQFEIQMVESSFHYHVFP
jgi:hypothetical protein